MLGQNINHYQITAKLGRGRLCEVYRAEDITPKRQVSIKIPSLNRSHVLGAFSPNSQEAAP